MRRHRPFGRAIAGPATDRKYGRVCVPGNRLNGTIYSFENYASIIINASSRARGDVTFSSLARNACKRNGTCPPLSHPCRSTKARGCRGCQRARQLSAVHRALSVPNVARALDVAGTPGFIGRVGGRWRGQGCRLPVTTSLPMKSRQNVSSISCWRLWKPTASPPADCCAARCSSRQAAGNPATWTLPQGARVCAFRFSLTSSTASFTERAIATL